MIKISIILMSTGDQVLMRVGEEIIVEVTVKERDIQHELFQIIQKYSDMCDARDKAKFESDPNYNPQEIYERDTPQPPDAKENER